LFNSIGTTEIIIIAAVLLLLFGGRKLPELGKGLGTSIKEFRGSFKDDKKKKK
jgi:sec-independent protein translocase protein TatA